MDATDVAHLPQGKIQRRFSALNSLELRWLSGRGGGENYGSSVRDGTMSLACCFFYVIGIATGWFGVMHRGMFWSPESQNNRPAKRILGSADNAGSPTASRHRHH